MLYRHYFSKHLPHQRHLDKEEKDKAAKLLHMRVNKKMLQQQLCQDTGKIVLLKDLSSISLDSMKGQSMNVLTEKYDMYNYYINQSNVHYSMSYKYMLEYFHYQICVL